MKLLPLLSKQFESSGMTLTGLKMNLITNAAGKTNWEDLQKSTKSQPTSTVVTTSVAAPLVIAITAVDVKDAEVNLMNEQTKQQLTIKQFNFNAKDISLNRPFPVSMKFHFVNKAGASGHVNLETEALFNIEKEYYQFKKSDFSAQIRQGAKELKFFTSANIIVDMKTERAEFQKWHGNLDNINWTGQMVIKNLAHQPVANGNIQTEPFELNQNQLKASHVKANVDFTFDTNKKSSPLQQLTANGLIRADGLQAQKIKASDLMAKAQLANGTLNFAPITAVLYQGNLQSSAKVDLNNSTLPLTLDAKVINVQAEPLFTDLVPSSSLKIKGTANAELHVTTLGSGDMAIQRNLNGNGKLSVNHGILSGVDIPYWVSTANALINKQEPSGSDTSQTPFGDLTATMVIRNGVVSNDDLLLQMPLYITNGKGTIDLVNQQINYSLKARAKMDPEKDKSDLLHIYGLTIPIMITGNLNNPKIGLDMGELMKQAAQQQIEKQKDKVVKQLQDQIPKEGAKILQNLLGN